MALDIFIHTFQMLVRNLEQALKVSVVPYLIIGVLTFLAYGTLGFSTMGGGVQPTAVGLSVLFSLLLIPVSLFVFAWIAVNWHRFILLEEYSGWVPVVSDKPIWSYVWRSILLGLLVMLIAIPLFLVLGGIFGAMGPNAVGASGPNLLITVISSLIAIPIAYVGMRIGVSLVGTALGKPLGFRDAWDKTKPIATVILGVVVILMALNLFLNLVLLIISPLPLIPDLIGFAVSWITMMLGISILTTIYGHAVEGRPLVTK